MGDSDDDVDYKRRDKFRTERRGYDSGMSGERGTSPGNGGRREWRDARPGPPGASGGWGGRGDRRSGGYYDRRDRYDDRRHEMSPPSKRMRGGDWDDRYDGGYSGGGGYHDRYGDHDRGYGSGYRGRSHRGPPGGDRGAADGPAGEGGQPVMMSFKAFLTTQDDSISDEEAIKKYADYKLEFKRQQLNEFFVSHKDEECERVPEGGAKGGSRLPSTKNETTEASGISSPGDEQPPTYLEPGVLNDLVLVILMLQSKFRKLSTDQT